MYIFITKAWAEANTKRNYQLLGRFGWMEFLQSEAKFWLRLLRIHRPNMQ
jgi:hypothetical protein